MMAAGGPATAEAPRLGTGLRLGGKLLDPGNPGALRAAILAQNGAMRLPGLPDEFNTAIIDPDKAEAFFAALTPALAAPFSGREVYLESVDLGISTASPTTRESFAKPFTLAVAGESKGALVPRAEIAADCPLARSRAAAARDLTLKTDAEVAAAEGPGKPSATAIRLLRQAVAKAWRVNAAAAARCAPGDPEAAAGEAAANQAVSASLVLGGGME